MPYHRRIPSCCDPPLVPATDVATIGPKTRTGKVQPRGGTPRSLATTYIESLAGKTPATVAAYRRSLRHFLAWLQAKPGCEAAFSPTTFIRTAAQVYFADLEE